MRGPGVDRKPRTDDLGEDEERISEIEAGSRVVPAQGLQGAHDRFGNAQVLQALGGGSSAFDGWLGSVVTAQVMGRPASATPSNSEVLALMARAAPNASGTSVPTSGIQVSAAPEAAAKGPSTTRDGLVDPYMANHWDPSAFHELGHEVGYPGNLSSDTVSTVSMLLPADTSPETRAVVEVMCAAACGFMDDVLITRAAEALGVSGDLLLSLVDLGSDTAQVLSLDDPTATALFATITLFELSISCFDLALDHVAGVVGDLSMISTAIGIATFALGQLPVAVATAVANVAGFATVEALLTALAAVSAAITAVTVAINVPLRGLQVSADLLRIGLDAIQYVYAERCANHSEAAGNFAKAEQYRELMRGRAFDLIEDYLNATMHVLLAIPFATTWKKYSAMALKTVLPGESGAVVGAVEKAFDAIAETEWWSDFASRLPDLPGPVDPRDLADPLRVDQGRSPFVERRKGAGLGPLSEARGRTIAMLDAGWLSLSGDAPEWHQGLVDDIANPSDGPGFDEATSPTYWIGQLVREMPFLAGLVADTSLEGIAAGCDLAAGLLPGTQPVFDGITLTLLELRPRLGELVDGFADLVLRQQLDLSRLEEIATQLELQVAGLRALVDPTEMLHGNTEEMVAMLDGLRVDPAKFQLPAWAPVSLVEQVVAPLNETIDLAIAEIRSLEQQVIETWRVTIDGALAAVEAEVEVFRAAVSDGGSLHVALEARLAAFRAQVTQAAEAFAEWDGVVRFDVSVAVAFLRSTAEAARAAAEAEGPDGTGDPWPAILRDTAMPAILAWRARHADEVAQQYHPTVPAWEVDACRSVHADATADPALSAGDRSALDAAWNTVRGFAGQTGREALYGLWEAEEVLIAAVSSARSR